jgi:hypothetical protein
MCSQRKYRYLYAIFLTSCPSPDETHRSEVNAGRPKKVHTLNVNINEVHQVPRSRVSSGSIVSDYELDDRVIGVRFPAGAEDFSSILCVQTGSGAHPASCTMGTGGPFPGGKSAVGV